MVNFSLENKVALVTGASRGIGESIAKTFAEYGAHVVLVSRKAESLEAVAESIRSNGGCASVIACNTGYPDQIKTLMDSVESEHGQLDILVNNAAANPHFGEMTTADEGIWDKTFDVNLKGPFFLIKYASELMEKNGGGSIVNVSSVNGVRSGFLQGIYSVTKAGLISMTQAFAKELAPRNIRVNVLLPGLTNTKFASAIIGNKDISSSVIDQIPLKRHAAPDEMAGAVLYLASSASSYTTGASIVCDGGLLI